MNCANVPLAPPRHFGEERCTAWLPLPIGATEDRDFLPVYKLCVFLFELRLQVAVGQTVALQLCHLLLQVADLRGDNQAFSSSHRTNMEASGGNEQPSDLGHSCTHRRLYPTGNHGAAAQHTHEQAAQ